ncbi:MAG TPA: hypothetical protein VEA40_17390 [Ramlibacter sp.]|nr:hypothetical protein [Ramlibacter sp.]
MTFRLATRFAPLLLAAALAGCATHFGLEPGASRDQVLSRLGRPTAVVKLPTGERLQYSNQASGNAMHRQAWMADLDGSGRLVRVYQALTTDNFQRIRLGEWTRAQVEQEFGPPARVDTAGNWNGPIMTYAWHDDIVDKYFWVYLDERGVVQRAHPGTDYRRSPDVP